MDVPPSPPVGQDGGGLVVVATPIGNLGDLSPRAAAALREADLVACEDTRRTAGLLRHAGASTPMVPAHAHNEAARAADLVARMLAGARVALVSDAGLPGVSDPGARVVRAAREAGLPVTVVPGPSAALTAVVASGLPVDRVVFAGFFPRGATERRRVLSEPHGATLVGYESPRRLPALLADLAELDPERPVAVCRELTKLYEEVAVGTAAELAARFAAPPRGEVTVVVGPASPPAPDADDEALGRGLALLLDAGMSPARAAEAVAALGAAPRNRAYRAALAAAEQRKAT
jgi:16S rRNA (cytidine1402-2'-O)-methyltransferase